MSKDGADALAFGGATLLVVLAIVIGCWSAGWIFGGIGQWWKDVTYVAPKSAEQKAQDAKDAEDWKNDPTNPDNIYKKCLADGGYPGNDGWGNVQCHFKEK